LTSVTDMSSMFFSATKFNQNLCAWGKFLPSPNISISGMFTSSNCTNKNIPTSSTGPFCAVTTCPSP
jgi:hypothetical protein